MPTASREQALEAIRNALVLAEAITEAALTALKQASTHA